MARPSAISTSDMQWLKMQLRVTALEESASRLSYRFEFPEQNSQIIVCSIYFTDDDSNSIKDISQQDKAEIYQGWISCAMSLINRAFVLEELPRSFTWNGKVEFILHENYGMGSTVVQTSERAVVLAADLV